jgi:hypothetical protein
MPKILEFLEAVRLFILSVLGTADPVSILAMVLGGFVIVWIVAFIRKRWVLETAQLRTIVTVLSYVFGLVVILINNWLTDVHVVIDLGSMTVYMGILQTTATMIYDWFVKKTGLLPAPKE